MKAKIVNAIKTWRENPENRFRGWLLADEIKEKHRVKIKEGFGAGISAEKWVAVYDTTLGNNGKKGIIFTEKELYFDKGESISLGELEAAYELNAIRFLFKMRNDSYKYYNSGNLREAIPILRLLTGVRPALEPPKQEYVELHGTYRRELRRRMNELTKKICEKNDHFVSIEMADEEFIQNALLRWPEVDKDKIIAFLKTVRGNGKEAVIITEDGMYSGINEPVKISLDGLKRFRYEESSYYALYNNDYIESKFFYVNDLDRENLAELTDGYFSIFENLKKEIASGHVIMSGLELKDGLKHYLAQREEQTQETYKNAIFVSSTFRDMHFERDIIHEKVQPALNALADKYGEVLSFCDLRWGVNTENLDSEEGAKKVLIVCMDEIEKCDPYMLIMLGERYGWIPKESTIKNALESRPEFVLDELEKSVTALEIEFGALSEQANQEKIFIYFREMEHLPSKDYASEDEYHKEKLNKLKERVKKIAPNRVKTYQLSWDEKTGTMDGVDEFAQMVIEDIGTVMESVWASREEKTPFEQEVWMHMAYMRQKSSLCYGREELLSSFLEKLEDRQHLLALVGNSGCGKSTIMGALMHALSESDVYVLPIFCGLTKTSETALGIIGHICYYMETLLQKEHVTEQSEEAWGQHLEELTAEYSKTCEKPLMILIDAIDQLMADSLRNNLKFIPNCADRLDSEVYVMISSLPEFDLAAFPGKVEVPTLDRTVKPKVIQGILKRNRRELDRNVIEKMIEKKASDSPLYLTLLIQRLLMMNKNDFDHIIADGDGMSAITKHQLEIVSECGEDIPEISKKMIEVAAERIGGDFVKQAIAYITISHHGLRESDLEGILTTEGIGWNRLEFSLFINYLRTIFLLREDGCYDFSHKVFRQIFTYEENEKRKLHKNLLHWLEQLSENDLLRERELLSHCLNARESKAFIHYMAKAIEAEKDIKNVTKQMLDWCRKDEGCWLLEMVRLIESERLSGEEINFFLKFVTEHIGRAFDNTEADLAIREKLFLELLPVSEYLVQTEGGLENERRVTVIYSRLGKIYELRKEYGTSEEYLKKALDYGMLLKERCETEKTVSDVSIDHRMLGNLYLKMEGEAYEQLALTYLQKSVQLGEDACEQYPDSVYAKRVLAWSYKRLGDYFRQMSQNDQTIAFYKKCYEVRKGILEEFDSVQEAESLADIIELIAHVFYETDRKYAKEYYLERVKYREKVCQMARTMEHMKELAWAYNDLGWEYYCSEKEEEQLNALDSYEKCIPVLEEILKMEWSENTCWHLADDYKYCMNILGKMKGLDCQKKVIKYAHRAWELYERRAETLETENAYLAFSLMLYDYAQVTSSSSEKCKAIEKRIEVLEKLYNMTKARDYKVTMKKLKLALASENFSRKF